MPIRKAFARDAAIIAEIYNESILAVDSTMINEPIDRDEIEGQMRKFTEREGYFVLENEKHIVGWGVIKGYGLGSEYQYTGETSVFLRRSETRKGYGSQLKGYLLDQCRAFGYHHLVARVWATNKASIEYNKQFGCTLVGIQKEIGFMDGQWKDIALMQLLLGKPPQTESAISTGQQPLPETIPQKREAHFVYKAENTVVGWGSLQLYSNRGGYRFCGEIRLWGQDKRKILKDLLVKAIEYKYHHLLVRLGAEDKKCLDVYLESGFEVVGIQKEIRYHDDTWKDVVVLQYLLECPNAL